MQIEEQPRRPGGDEASALRDGLRQALSRWLPSGEDRDTPIPGLTFFRRIAPSPPRLCLLEPSVVLVVQGAKQLLVGEHAYVYDAERFLIASLDLPASSQVLQASPATPCLGLTLKLDLRVMAELMGRRGQASHGRGADGSAAIGAMTPALLATFARLVALLDEPEAIDELAPLVQREIHYRLLTSDQAARLWHIASIGSQGHRIGRAVDWLKQNYAQALRIEDLAGHVGMSPSSLYLHFRQLTSMSPLQYQKWLRLNEARRLMLNERADAASAAFVVGYESPSQFNREYGRLFGSPPRRDIEGLRRQADAGQRRQGE